MPLRAGDVVVGLRGRYGVESRHGEGSFGVTYRARDLGGGGTVIVKELRIEKLDDWKALELFEREGEVLAGLSHPNIPAFRDFFAHGAPTPLPVSATSSYAGGEHLSLVLVQQFVTGATLQQRADLGQRLAPDEGLTVLRALLEALSYLHERTPPLVHRDIKPGNIILTPEGQPFLVDFGAIQNRLTGPGSTSSTIVGTVGYMPLEQIRGDARPASDLYALGVTLTVALAGKPLPDLPFDDSAGRIDLRRALPRDTPDALREALGSMIAPLLGQRAQSATDVLRQLDATLTPAATPLAAMPAQDDFAAVKRQLATSASRAAGRSVLIAVLASAAILGGGVAAVLGTRQSILDWSKQRFAKLYTCPIASVQGRDRPDLHVSDLTSSVKQDNGDEIIELTGCGHDVLWACRRGQSLISCGYERVIGAPSAATAQPASPAPPATAPLPVMAPLACPFAARQTWAGTYICAQGSTSVLLRVTRVDHDWVDAIFEFDYQPKAVHGSFHARGHYDPVTHGLDLEPGTWIEQPPHYVTVAMHGAVTPDGQTFRGAIDGPSCTTFSVNLGGS